MRKLYYSDAAVSAVTGFIRAYEEAFFELYQDSGLVTEKMIIENYRRSAKKLSEQIFSKIDKHLVNEKVLGRKTRKHWNEITFYVGTRLITVYYSSNGTTNERIVEVIGIERKPIIF